MGTCLQVWFYYNEGIMSNKLHDWRFTPLFTSLCFQGTYHHKMCAFLSVWRFLLFFICPWTPLFTWCVVSCHMAPCPLSLLIPSYLPAVTISPFPSANHYSLCSSYTFGFCFCLFVWLSICFCFILHIGMKSYKICLSLSDLFHLA